MENLPPPRRIVTGHAADGSPTFESTESIPPQTDTPHAKLLKAAGGGTYALWNTGKTPANAQESWEEPNDKGFPLWDPSGTRLVVFDLPPGLSSPMHRTLSVDYIVIVAGELVLELGAGGEETLVKTGDVVIQRGTLHAWHNRSDKTARMIASLIPAETVKVGGEELPFEYPLPELPEGAADNL